MDYPAEITWMAGFSMMGHLCSQIQHPTQFLRSARGSITRTVFPSGDWSVFFRRVWPFETWGSIPHRRCKIRCQTRGDIVRDRYWRSQFLRWLSIFSSTDIRGFINLWRPYRFKVTAFSGQALKQLKQDMHSAGSQFWLGTGGAAPWPFY
jgi:hypothetical protein